MTDKLIELFAEELELNTNQLNEDSSPDNIEKWDSLASMRLVVAIEEKFNIRLTTTDILKMQSIGKARTILENLGVKID